MRYETMTKHSFSLLGKEGSTRDGDGFVQRLWQAASAGFPEIASLAMRSEQGGYAGFWGAMSDFTRSFYPWEQDFSQGWYLAGVECCGDAVPPQGWTRWDIPGFVYLMVDGREARAFQVGLDSLREAGLPLAGAVQEFTDPESGITWLLFPYQRLESVKAICTQRLTIRLCPEGEMRWMIAETADASLRDAYREMLENSVTHTDQRDWYAAWRIVENGSGKAVGDLCFKGLNAGVVEIGYGIADAFQRRGYASEAVAAMCRWAVKQPGVLLVEAETEPDNRPSQCVLEKCGFVPTGKLGEEGPRFVYAG